jgi:hypothetical protein
MSNGLTLPFQATLDTEGEAFRIVVTGGGTAIYGSGLGTDRFGDIGQGVVGETDVGQGVLGHATGSGGIGVWGESQSGDGVHGLSHSVNSGVAGLNDNATRGTGVWGESQHGEGVHGISHHLGAGVAGFNDGPQGAAAQGVWGESQNGEGVHGLSRSAQYAGVSGNNDHGGTGVYAETSSYSGNALDIHGAIRVASSGDGTTPAAFRFTVTLANIYPPIPSVSPSTSGFGATIDHPLLNNDPSALLFVTPVASQRGKGFSTEFAFPPTNTAVVYGIQGTPIVDPPFPSVTDKWVLVTGGSGYLNLEVGDTFNILVIRTN